MCAMPDRYNFDIEYLSFTLVFYSPNFEFDFVGSIFTTIETISIVTLIKHNTIILKSLVDLLLGFNNGLVEVSAEIRSVQILHVHFFCIC